nr:uncharacterized protein LOC109147157 isoform X1 [Ipomoea batatas]GMD30115.1 uncharacterized protein LOC109147157 isoform X1 [Ipomoea batatas]GME04902.1 uncharacterized protein LOC109147157 isoform X1 [Ipomoea batatas]GME04903.1 uncharacterized protein LOC109147157 isoform X1 [Ipomoea batatas]GME04905.1 uncharacterized protein LOC109147157 isoform X1 [Ipomoea batatas]
MVAAITESGLANAEQMCEYTANKVARNTAVKTAYADCATLLYGTALQLKVAVNILKHSGVD